MNEARIDKWLWAARIFKTRSMAAAACKKGQVSMKGAQLKPSRTVKPGDVIEVRKPPVTYSFKVKQTIEKRVGAKLIPEILEKRHSAGTIRTSGDEPPERLRRPRPWNRTPYEERPPELGGVHHTRIFGRPVVRLRCRGRRRRGR